MTVLACPVVLSMMEGTVWNGFPSDPNREEGIPACLITRSTSSKST